MQFTISHIFLEENSGTYSLATHGFVQSFVWWECLLPLISVCDIQTSSMFGFIFAGIGPREMRPIYVAAIFSCHVS